jgi:hypothetical protein
MYEYAMRCFSTEGGYSVLRPAEIVLRDASYSRAILGARVEKDSIGRNRCSLSNLHMTRKARQIDTSAFASAGSCLFVNWQLW